MVDCDVPRFSICSRASEAYPLLDCLTRQKLEGTNALEELVFNGLATDLDVTLGMKARNILRNANKATGGENRLVSVAVFVVVEVGLCSYKLMYRGFGGGV